MKKIVAASCALALLAVSACSGITPPVVTPTPPGPPGPPSKPTTIGNDACAVYNTIAWALPLVTSLAAQGRLNATDQQILADAKAVIDAGCHSTNTSLLARAAAAAQALVAILWPAAL